MGLGLNFADGEGPRFERPLRDEAAVARLAVPDMDRLRYVFDAVARDPHARSHGRVPLIGFSGSPWTLACYMVEGARLGRLPRWSRRCCTAGPTCCTASSPSTPTRWPPTSTRRSTPARRP